MSSFTDIIDIFINKETNKSIKNSNDVKVETYVVNKYQYKTKCC